MHKAIGEMMKEAAVKTKQEIEALKKIYNTNLEKLIGEFSLLEMVKIVSKIVIHKLTSSLSYQDKNDLQAQLEKALRNKKSLEQELEKVALNQAK